MLESGLYIVPTPIGNLGDMTARALEVLAAVDVIAAEDTRHSRRLLDHFGIGVPLLSYHEHNEIEAAAQLLERLQSGQSVALISDAGTPLVSDPGYRLVRAAQDAGVAVIPLPGPCAAITALSAGGLPANHFHFEGFLSGKSGQRRRRLGELRGYPGTLVFYEAPHRIADMLRDAAASLGSAREAVLARELTKAFETIRRLPLGELADWVATDRNQQRGEQVVLIGPDTAIADRVDSATLRLLEGLAAELPPRRAAALVAEYSGYKARVLYDWLLARRGSDVDSCP